MDDKTRKVIRLATQDARALLERELAEQLEGTFDILLNGSVAPEPGAHLDAAQRQVREKLVAAVQHQRSRGHKATEAVAAYLREAAFTCLNRFVALKMLEARDLVQQCVSKGELSAGFREFGGLASGLAALPGKGYRLYIESLFDEIAVEVKVLFDRRDPASLLWPRRAALTDLLDILNRPELAEVWGEDETIGWVYQYFNGDDERRRMREESQAPRNSRELAVRNQFFTPRYVVEFLTDNTLGRTWYEMRRGRTRLVDQCQYLVRRPREVFLEDLSQFDAHRPPDFIRAAASGDFALLPERLSWANLELLALCVNGHEIASRLGFDAVDALYRGLREGYDQTGEWQGNAAELWSALFRIQRGCHHGYFAPEGDELRAVEALYTALRRELQADTSELSQEELLNRPVFVPHRPEKDPRELKILDPACGSGHFLLYAFDLLLAIYEEAFGEGHGDAPPRAEWPGLILRHNLHGIDIDPRAAQIAALALWMRAQRALNDDGIARAERPQVQKTNVVVAEPMPGDKELLEEFLTEVDPRLRPLVRKVVEEMKLAGEAGSLLKIEDALSEAIEKARRERFAGPSVQLTMLDEDEPKQLVFEFAPAEEFEFWDNAEEELLRDLAMYGARAAGATGVRRRMFAHDAAEGFAFVDLCRQRYEVILMNPPFGACSGPAKAWLGAAYPRTKNDLYAAFVERGVQWLRRGCFLGAITSRTGFFLSSFQKWREEILLKEAPPTVFADLGYGVLDSAMVEVAAYCLRKVR